MVPPPARVSLVHTRPAITYPSLIGSPRPSPETLTHTTVLWTCFCQSTVRPGVSSLGYTFRGVSGEGVGEWTDGLGRDNQLYLVGPWVRGEGWGWEITVVGSRAWTEHLVLQAYVSLSREVPRQKHLEPVLQEER